MKKIGFFVLVIGLAGLIVTLGMDTTVASSRSYDRIHNIGLMNEKQNFLLVSVAIAIAGVVTLVFGYRSEPSGQASNKVAANAGQATRTCPFCAEQIMAQAVVCRYCGRDISPLDTSASESAPAPALPKASAGRDNVSRFLSQVENSLRAAFAPIANSAAMASVLTFGIRLNEHIGKIAIVLLLSGLFGFVYFGAFADYSVWEQHANRVRIYRLQDTASIFFAGLFLLLRNALRKPSIQGSDAETKTSATGKSSRQFFGEVIDLVAIQAAMVLMLVVIHRDGQLKTAYVLALLVAAMGYLLVRLGSRVFGYATIFCGAIYLVYRHFVFDDLGYSLESLRRALEGPPLISVTPYIWLLLASVAVPHLRLVRLGSLQYGRLRGDMSFNIAGHEISLPLVSALVFSVLWIGIFEAVAYGYYSTIDKLF
ncbi:MAG: DUF2905 family protein [Sulfuritalea sp.]|nr:DUF2905 family protein [Sulfuritalea sp.]